MTIEVFGYMLNTTVLIIVTILAIIVAGIAAALAPERKILAFTGSIFAELFIGILLVVIVVPNNNTVLSTAVFSDSSTPLKLPLISTADPSVTNTATPFAFAGRTLEGYKINPSLTMFMPDQYWDGSRVRYLDLEYHFTTDESHSGISKIKYAYIFSVHAKSANPPEIDIEALPVQCVPFNIAASFEVPINHERVDNHYHYDHYFIVLEDYAGNIVLDYLNVLWVSGDDSKNKYNFLIIYQEDWDDEAYLQQNEFAAAFMTQYNLYSGNPRPVLCQVSQNSLSSLREKIITTYDKLKDKTQCEDVGKGAVIVPAG